MIRKIIGEKILSLNCLSESTKIPKEIVFKVTFGKHCSHNFISVLCDYTLHVTEENFTYSRWFGWIRCYFLIFAKCLNSSNTPLSVPLLSGRWWFFFFCLESPGLNVHVFPMLLQELSKEELLPSYSLMRLLSVWSRKLH